MCCIHECPIRDREKRLSVCVCVCVCVCVYVLSISVVLIVALSSTAVLSFLKNLDYTMILQILNHEASATLHLVCK